MKYTHEERLEIGRRIYTVSVKCSYDGTSPEHLAPRA